MAAKKESLDRQDNHRKLDPNDYDSLISPHSIFEAKQQKLNSSDIPGFSGYTNADKDKTNEVRSQTNLPPWHYNPWWMLASTSRVTSSDFQNGADLKVKEEPSGMDSLEHDSLKQEMLDQLAPGTPSPETEIFIICDECSDPFCDTSADICRKLFHCPHCRKSYPTVLEFNTHLTGVHPVQKPFRCQVCLAPFDRKSQLRRHLDSSHTRKDVNKCSVCSKYIKDKSNLRKHMQVHTGRVPQKQFKCDLCNNKRYMSLDRLNNHRIVCTGEKVLKYCDMCTKVFDNSRSLNSHKKVHARDLKCDSCGEQFRSLEHLTNHKLVCRLAVETTPCEAEKPAYLNIPGYMANRALDVTLTTLKTQMN